MELIHTVYEPAGPGPHPTIVALHGWGANAMDLLGLAPYVADGRFMVICPQGPMEVPIGPVRGFGWYPISMNSPPGVAEIESGASAVERFLEQAAERYPIDRRKVVALGFSQGGVIAYMLAFRKPERFAALVCISSWLPELLPDAIPNRETLAQLPILVQHGRADELIEISRARDALKRLRDLGVPVTFREYDCGHEITADGLEDLSKFLKDRVLSPIITL